MNPWAGPDPALMAAADALELELGPRVMRWLVWFTRAGLGWIPTP